MSAEVCRLVDLPARGVDSDARAAGKHPASLSATRARQAPLLLLFSRSARKDDSGGGGSGGAMASVVEGSVGDRYRRHQRHPAHTVRQLQVRVNIVVTPPRPPPPRRDPHPTLLPTSVKVQVLRRFPRGDGRAHRVAVECCLMVFHRRRLAIRRIHISFAVVLGHADCQLRQPPAALSARARVRLQHRQSRYMLRPEQTPMWRAHCAWAVGGGERGRGPGERTGSNWRTVSLSSGR